MNRRRYIPLVVRVQVALRQVTAIELPPVRFGMSDRDYLNALLFILFAHRKYELHHRPALVNRQMNRRKTDTVPPSNDPAYLVYLLKDEEHWIETYVRGVGAQRSDVSQRRYLKRVAKNRSDAAPKRRVANRGFNKSPRPLRSANRWPPKGSQKIRSRR